MSPIFRLPLVFCFAHQERNLDSSRPGTQPKAAGSCGGTWFMVRLSPAKKLGCLPETEGVVAWRGHKPRTFSHNIVNEATEDYFMFHFFALLSYCYRQQLSSPDFDTFPISRWLFWFHIPS
jgi:hypothetical protein